jgi:pimeloyl-ACP methyl ester carboxylesterase
MVQRDSNPGARLASSAGGGLFEGPLGRLVARPWLDRVAVKLVARSYLPLSRAWAAALAAEGSEARFREALPGLSRPSRTLSRALPQVQGRWSQYQTALVTWDELFFGTGGPVSDDRLVAAETARRSAAHELMASRGRFLPLLRRLPAVRWEVPGPEQVEGEQGARLNNAAHPFPAPAAVEVETSHKVPSARGSDHWLHFASPVLGDRAWARVSEPEGVRDPPTVIFLHGIAMESDQWRPGPDPLDHQCLAHCRVIRPEGPWHGRRRLPGWYGGEPAIGRGLLGLLELFQAWIAEVAVLIAWARETGRGPVAVAGVSLGALTGQLLATAVADWPAQHRPDALFLVATSGDILSVAHDGSLGRALGLAPQLTAAGWDRAAQTRWLPLLQPAGPPALDPERIVLLVGQADDLTPAAGGLALGRDWSLPEANFLVRPQGHFSVWFGLLGDPRAHELARTR